MLGPTGWGQERGRPRRRGWRRPDRSWKRRDDKDAGPEEAMLLCFTGPPQNVMWHFSSSTSQKIL
jgi:hypothetical protein